MVIGTKQISKREKNKTRRSWVCYYFKEKNQEKIKIKIGKNWEVVGWVLAF